MPGKVKVKIIAGRNLPVMDRSSDTTDAFVEVKLGSTTFKTEVFRKSLNPQWNSEWFKFEVDDEELQDEPLQIRIMDHDTYSAHDAIGKVYVDLNPLLGPHSGPSVTQHVEQNSSHSRPGSMLSGWFPVFDTMHGVRGEIFLVVKVELFSDVNRFRQSSCGVRFFSTPAIPSGYNIYTICGFVEELVVNDDPEYQWIDKIRTQRSSNEARQTLFLKLSGEVRRRIGLKALDLGGNAVIGYKQFFDLEGESGVVVRGIGTVASLHKKNSAGETYLHFNSAVADYLTNALLEEMTPCPLLARKLTPQPIRVERAPRYNPFSPPSVRSERSIRKPSEFLGSSGRRWSLPLKVKIMNFVQKLRKGLVKENTPTISESENEAGCSREPTELTYLTNQVSLKTVEEHMTIFDSHAEFALESGESQVDVGQEQGRGESICFITSSESECSSMMSPEPPDFCSGQNLTLPKIHVEASFYSYDAVDMFKPQNPPTRLRKRACTLPNLCQCPSSLCGGLTCVSLSVPNPLTIRQNGTERFGSPSNQKMMKLPVVKKKSSETDLSTTPKGLSSSCELPATHLVRQMTGSQHIYDLQHEMSEYPFLTLSTYPRNFIVHIGGTVSARSVKLLDRITNPDEPETRDAWWLELRLEVRSHARALGCTFVLGYTEQTSICDEVCILSASGTAAVVDFQQIESFENRTRHSSGGFGMASSFERDKVPKEQRSKDFGNGIENQENPPCSPCHVPYLPANIMCPVKLSRCNSCRKHKVPDVLLATIEIPKELRVEGRGCLIQARVCRAKREYRGGGDSQAREVSDALPFLEYELHRQLLAKLRVRGMNAVFGLHVEVSIGEKHIIGLATGTAVFLSSLPPGRPPAISATGNKEDQLKVAQLSKKLMDLLVENREFYGIKESVIKESAIDVTDYAFLMGSYRLLCPEGFCEMAVTHLQELDDEDPKTSDMSEESDDELPDIHFVADNKETCILEIDDPSELDIASILADDRPPKSFHCCTTELLAGLSWRNVESSYLAFTRVWQGRGTYPFSQKQLDDCFNILLQGLYFQLRRASPCLISGLKFAVDLPDEETIQITIFGMASRLRENVPAREGNGNASGESSLIFKLDEEQVNGDKKPQKEGFQPKNEGSSRDHPVIEITPLSRVPGTKIEKYLGNLNFFFIRESTSIRESGGLSTLVASFISEVFAIARAHVAALGGNAMVAFSMSQYVLVHNPHKNQGLTAPESDIHRIFFQVMTACEH